MRIAVYGLIMAALAQQAVAADAPFPILRGAQVQEIASPAYFRWEGVYVGGQVGAGTSNMNFSEAPNSIIAHALRQSTLEAQFNVSQWPVLSSLDTRAASAGGFIGYNAQFEDVVLGVEGNYNRTSLTGSQADMLGRAVTTTDGNTYHTFVNASASMHIQDYATLRGRAGWAAGRFLPYAMLGFAFGMADFQRTAFVDGAVVSPAVPPNPPPPPFFFGPWGATESKKAFIYGYSAGGGL
ncbi:MAG TPA: porin family protein, partial [Bradyrhizobium sp.]|nr:porin family protein [Bradyrhizobium sp.]